ncbi:hypothetical protein GCM10020000_33450 [Streptomyces olivoverticillatus]
MSDPAVPAVSHPGLTATEVAARVARGEVNDVPVRSSRSITEIVRANVFTRFNAIIGVLFLIILVVGPIQDGLFGFVIVANTAIGIVQELRAKKTLDSLAVIGEAKPTVRRDGAPTSVRTGEIVLGDLIELGPGEKCVVDGEVREADGLEIDESLLTGEADPVLKKPGDAVMSGSFVVAGGGAYTATKVGREAYAAQLAEEASRFTLVHSELRTGISQILKYVTWMMVPVAIGLILSQLVVQRHDWKEAVRRMVAGIVPMVPEGLVLLTSVAFAIGVVRLGRKQCLVQELPAIEGLARVDVVCLDKTGTLTEGGMDVTELRLLPAARADEGYVRQVLGALGASDPRPNASLQAIIDAYPDGSGWHCTETLPFSSARKYSGASLDGPDAESGSWLLGAPDVLLPEGHTALGEVEDLNAQGLRVLLLARTERELGDPGVTQGVRPTALVVLEQRLRTDAADTLRYFAEQHVSAKVISGDNAVSVGAVAAKLALTGAESPVDARRLPAGRGRWPRRWTGGRSSGGSRRSRSGTWWGGAAVARAHGRDDRRRGQRRAGPEGRRHRRLDGLGLGGDAGRRPDCAARQQLRLAAVRGRRGPPGDRQHHAGGHAVPDEDGLLGAAGDPRRLHARALPLPAAAPDAAVDADDRRAEPSSWRWRRTRSGRGRTSYGG